MTQEVSELIAQLHIEKTKLTNQLNIEGYKMQQILEAYPEIRSHLDRWIEISKQSPNMNIPLKSIPKDTKKEIPKTK